MSNAGLFARNPSQLERIIGPEQLSAAARSYSAAMSVSVGTNITATTNVSMAQLFHAGGGAAILVSRLMVTTAQAAGANVGKVRFHANFISALGAGGNAEAITPHERGGAASECTYTRGAGTPTRVGGFFWTMMRAGNQEQAFAWDIISSLQQPILLRRGLSEGIEVHSTIETALAQQIFCTVSMTWTEVP